MKDLIFLLRDRIVCFMYYAISYLDNKEFKSEIKEGDKLKWFLATNSDFKQGRIYTVIIGAFGSDLSIKGEQDMGLVLFDRVPKGFRKIKRGIKNV